jgi:nucleoside-diphosphate-sugar epimerase
MARYTVIGAGGFVGTRLTRVLKDAGLEVFTPVRDDPGLFDRDLGRVFYCAGLTADYLARPFDTVEAHVTLLARLLRDARFERLVYCSSTRLYDWMGPDAGREDEALVLEPFEPRHLYDLSKALGENLCLTQSGGRASVARLACVWDWSDGAPGFLARWMQQARHSRAIALDSASGAVRDYVTLDDTVAALRAMADTGAEGTVNVASGENVSNEELAQVFEAHGWTVALARTTPKQVAPVVAIDRLRGLGIEPVPVRQAIEAQLKRGDFLEAG